VIASGTKAKIRALFAAINRLEGLPARGVVVGGPDHLPAEVQLDEAGNPVETPGFTMQACDPPDEAGTQAALEIPAALEKWLGRTVTVGGKSITLPTREELVDEDALPAALKAIRQARREAKAPVSNG
jgi:hypothetical protein